VSSYLILQADAYGKTGNFAEGYDSFAEAQEFIRNTEERFWEAELYRLYGELTLRQESQNVKAKTQKSKFSHPKPQILEPEAEAEVCYHKAIDIARRQQAKSFELRAVMSLARLWQHQGKHNEAYQMLAELYDWFTEGFDTKDLQEAKGLLTALSRQNMPEPTLPEMAGQGTSPPNLRLVVSKQSKAPRSPRIRTVKRGRT
jgi:predicted ATPase